MSLSEERTYLADLQPGLLDDHEQDLLTRLSEYNSQYPPPDDALLSPPPAEADPLETLPSHGSHSNRDWEMGDYSSISLRDLELNGNDGLSNSGIFENTFRRTSKNGADADSSRNVPETINPMLSSEFGNSSWYRAYTIHTPFQTPSAAEPSSPWQRSNHRSGGSPANLQPHIYNPHRSSAATDNQYSDSAWETLPQTPSADDPDPRPVPDGNSASLQSYNNPQTGIWPQVNTYARDSTYSPPMGMRHGNGTNSNVTHILPQSLQKLFANADAATPFGTEADSNEGPLLVSAGLGADGKAAMAIPSLPPPSIIKGLLPQSSNIPFHSGSTILNVANDAMDSAIFPVQDYSPEVEHLFLPPISNQEILPNIAPMILLDNAPLSVNTLPPAMSLDPPTSAVSALDSASTSDTAVSGCDYRGCQAKFAGGSTKDSLRRHKLHYHGHKPKPKCPECQLVIQSGRRDNLIRHVTRKHPGHPSLASLNVRGRKAPLETAVPVKRAKGQEARQPA